MKKSKRHKTKSILLLINSILLVLCALLIPMIMNAKGYTMSTEQELFIYIILCGIWFIISYIIKGIFDN